MTTDDGSLLRRILALDEESSTALTAFVNEVSVTRANAFAWGIRGYASTLTTSELCRLVKVFTRLENDLKTGFCGGSTTQVPLLLSELRGRDARRAEALTAWAFEVAENPYNPFGTLSASRQLATSVDEYWRLEKERFARRRGNEALRSAAAKHRTAQRALNHAARVEVHAEYNRRRRAFLDELEGMPPLARLRAVVVNGSWRLGAIPGEYADAVAATQLSIEERQRLLIRLKYAPRGPWSVLRAGLEALTSAASRQT